MAGVTALRTERDVQQTTRSLVFGIALWFVDLNVVYALPSLACRWGWFSFSIAGLSGLQVVEALISLVTIVVMLQVIYQPGRVWRTLQSEDPVSNAHLLQDTDKDRLALVACVVMLLNSAFLLFLISSFVPILALSACRPS
jgi:hypothetical protein